MQGRSESGFVYLVGAGPGDPGLLTLRAVECLQQADFVLHDYLTSFRTLAHARSGAEILCVDQLPGQHPQRWPVIHERIIAEARQGKIVVHLKGGDPLIFGRGGEEAEALRQAGIGYEIVPGVTAALAAGAYAEIPLTHRAHASAVAFVTGHEHPGKANSRLDWDALARFPGTLAFYMGVGRLGSIANELMARGKPADTGAAMVHHASTGGQRTVVGTLATIEASVRDAGLTSPSLLLVGSVVGLKVEPSWFEARPLAGKRILITRPKSQAESFARKLELLGAIPEILPVIDVVPPSDWSSADRGIERLQSGEVDWLVFTSANGVRAFFARVFESGHDLRSLGKVQLASIGSATARSLAEFHLRPDISPSDEMDSERLAESLGAQVRGQRVLLAQAAEGRELLRQSLGQAATIEVATVYRQIAVLDPALPAMERLRKGEIEIVTLTSPNIARAFLAGCDEQIRVRLRDGSVRLLVNSERLRSQLAKDGYRCFVSRDPTEAGLMEALTGLVDREATTISHPDKR